MRLITLLIFLSLTACGKFESKKAIIDQALLPHIEQYKIDKKIHLGISDIEYIDVVFGELNRGQVGVCYIYDGGYKIIYIDRVYWSGMDESTKLVLIYHEMGHCDLGIMEHSEDYTIMGEYLMSGVDFNMNRDYYLNLLFKEHK